MGNLPSSNDIVKVDPLNPPPPSPPPPSPPSASASASSTPRAPFKGEEKKILKKESPLIILDDSPSTESTKSPGNDKNDIGPIRGVEESILKMDTREELDPDSIESRYPLARRQQVADMLWMKRSVGECLEKNPQLFVANVAVSSLTHVIADKFLPAHVPPAARRIPTYMMIIGVFGLELIYCFKQSKETFDKLKAEGKGPPPKGIPVGNPIVSQREVTVEEFIEIDRTERAKKMLEDQIFAPPKKA